MNVLKITRSSEWWEYKMPPLLAIGYATTLRSHTGLLTIAPKLLVLLVALIAGAIYVSIINDITDIEEDLASGKKNRMAGLPKIYWLLLPLLCMIIGFSCFYTLHLDTRSWIFYVLAWVIFSLYSIPPIRLKKRGIWGVFADACGSHLFPGCLIVSATLYLTGRTDDLLWLVAIGIWSFFYGLRGILWHQFFDRENDLMVGIPTLASKVEPSDFKIWEWIITAIEIIAFAFVLVQLSLPFTLVALVLYFVLIWYRASRLQIRIITIIAPPKSGFQIWMAEYYQVFWPLSLLVTAAIAAPSSIYILLIHLLLFHKNPIIIAKDFLRMPKYL